MRRARVHVDLRAVLALALPLIANSAVQVVLNLTDVWFIGHISMQALAAVGAVQWLVLVFVMLLGGVAMAVQPRVAQAYGGRRYWRASQATWTALWGILCAAAALSRGGRLPVTRLLAPFGFKPADRRSRERLLAAAPGRGPVGHGALGGAELL